MLRRTLRSLGRFLVSVAEDEGVERRRPSRSPKPKDFGRRAAQLAQTRGAGDTLVAGGIELLGLQEILRQTHAMEQVDADALRDIAESAIARHLGPEDSFVRRDLENYLLCFASPDRSMARRKLDQITSDIRARLSEITDDDLDVAHEIVEIDVSDVDDESIIGTITQSLKRVKQEAEDTSRLWRQHLIRNASVSYRPVWQSQKQIIAVHRAVLDDETGRFALRRLTNLSSGEEMRSTLFEIDSLILGRATTDLHNLVGDGGRTQLIIPLYFNSVESRRRRARYQQICESIPQAYFRYLLFEIHDIPSGTPTSRLSEIIAMLNKYGRGVLLEVEMGIGGMPTAMGIAGVVTRAPSGPCSLPEFARQATRFAADARTARARSFIYDIDSPSMAQIAVTAGIDYLQGTAIARTTKELRAHYRWDLMLAS